MAPRSSRSRRDRAAARTGDGGARPELFTRQRLTIGALTAFGVAFSYVAANALWYQPHAHGGAFFATRTFERDRAPRDEEPAAQAPAAERSEPEIETIIRLEQETPVPPERPARSAAPPHGDDDVRAVQSVLSDLRFYDGEIDGLDGPQTRRAIEAYQAHVGLETTGRVDRALLAQLGSDMDARSADAETDSVVTASNNNTSQEDASNDAQDEMVVKIQAGLKAFGNDGISLDGELGEPTRDAILEFQSLFGLEQTGAPSEEVYAKMREIGLTN